MRALRWAASRALASMRLPRSELRSSRCDRARQSEAKSSNNKG